MAGVCGCTAGHPPTQPWPISRFRCVHSSKHRSALGPSYLMTHMAAHNVHLGMQVAPTGSETSVIQACPDKVSNATSSAFKATCMTPPQTGRRPPC